MTNTNQINPRTYRSSTKVKRKSLRNIPFGTHLLVYSIVIIALITIPDIRAVELGVTVIIMLWDAFRNISFSKNTSYKSFDPTPDHIE